MHTHTHASPQNETNVNATTREANLADVTTELELAKSFAANIR
jgi:hypothetical protein